MSRTKKVTIFIDTEGFWEDPVRKSFDVDKVILGIKNTLEKHNAKAVFNVLGKVAENSPSIIGALHRDGHEIASHGYSHESFVQMNREDINKTLEKTEKLIYQATRTKPKGFRAPWTLMNKDVYDILRKRKYIWSSNKRRLHTEQVNNPSSSFKQFYLKIPAILFIKLKSLSYNKKPFFIENIKEISMYSSMDGELLGLLDPEQESSKKWIDYAYKSWVSQFNKSGEYFNLNLHDWLIGTKNRLDLLDKILKYMKSKNAEFVLARDL